MRNILRTDSGNPDFVKLVKMLDADLAERDGEDHSFYAQFNRIDTIRYAVVVYEDRQAVGCGAIKVFGDDAMEIKRMFVLPERRHKGIAAMILSELERWASEFSCRRCVLETGKRQPEAIALYTSRGYKQIPNYGQYAGIDNSICFEKMLSGM